MLELYAKGHIMVFEWDASHKIFPIELLLVIAKHHASEYHH